MFSVYVEASLMEDRLDAGFYRPDYLTLSKHLVELGGASLNSLVDGVECGPFGGNAIADDLYAEQGIAFIRPVNISSHTFDDSCLVRVPRQVLLNGNLKIYDGTNLYFGRVGDPCVALIEGETSISPNIIVAKTNNNKADPYYLYAFAASSFGLKQLLRQLKTVAQPTTSTQAVKSLIIYKAQPITQQYIGDKVRQAERLRAWAKGLRAEVDNELNQFKLPTNASPEIYNRVSTARLEDRLDPRPYRTLYLRLVDAIKQIENSPISRIAELFSGCPVSSNDFMEKGDVPLVRIRNIGFDVFISLDTGVTQKIYREAVQYQAKENLIVLGMDGIFRAQFFLAEELPMLVNQRVAMLQAHDIRPELLTHWLNRPEGQMQLNQWAVKTTVEHTSLFDIGRVRIPRLGRSLENQLADKLLYTRLAYRYSRFLTEAAKFLIEALIEGQLTEQQLIAAQQQLEAGDHSADQAILSRLKTDGFDGNGPVLFSNLEQLYTLLEQAKKDSWMLAA